MDVFVYGTLLDPGRARSVLGNARFLGDAVLDGLRRVEGRLLRTNEVDRLDAYEGVDRDLYVRVPVRRTDGGTAQVYVGDPGRLDAAADWPGTGPFDERVRRYVEGHDVVVRLRNRQG